MGRAAIFCVLGIGVLSLMDALIKDATARYPVVQAAFLRFCFGFLAASIAIAILRPGWPSRETIQANSLRSLVVVATSLAFFYSVSVLPLAEAAALSFLAPVFIVLLSTVLLGERPGPRISVALALGLAGMLVIVSGKIGTTAYTDRALLGALAAVSSAALFATGMVMLRSRAQRDATAIIVLFHSLGPVVVLLAPALLVWSPPTARDLAQFAVIGTLGFAGHSLLALAFARAEASRLAALDYTALVWATLYGFLFFGDVPAPLTIAGALLIACGAAFAHRR
jgi:S-adenosylmethionine uptake transporter